MPTTEPWKSRFPRADGFAARIMWGTFNFRKYPLDVEDDLIVPTIWRSMVGCFEVYLVTSCG